MPNPKLVSYQNCLSGDNLHRFLLAESALNFRNEMQGSISIGQNVGVVLFVYKGEIFGPFAARSASDKQNPDPLLHGEMIALAYAVNAAINASWGPFTGMAEITPKNITDNAELLAVLQQLDCIKVFSERAFCDYGSGKGCLPYFKGLENSMGESKIEFFHALPPQTNAAREAEKRGRNNWAQP